jgi:glutaconate CoA-transferase subunit A
MPVAGHVGSDYPKLRPEFRIVTNPFDANQRVLVVPAIRPDVAIIHAIVAAPDGTCLLDHMEDDVLLAQASRVVIASAERIVTVDELRRMGTGAVLEGIHVTAVVETPGGAYPTLVRGLWELDGDYIREYIAAARDDESFRAWLARYVYAPEVHAADHVQPR